MRALVMIFLFAAGTARADKVDWSQYIDNNPKPMPVAAPEPVAKPKQVAAKPKPKAPAKTTARAKSKPRHK